MAHQEPDRTLTAPYGHPELLCKYPWREKGSNAETNCEPCATASLRGWLRELRQWTDQHTQCCVNPQGQVVSEILGDASIVITADINGHVSPDVSREALATLSASLLA